jgi:hypothetical protein
MSLKSVRYMDIVLEMILKAAEDIVIGAIKKRTKCV